MPSHSLCLCARNSAASAHGARDLSVRACVGFGDKVACGERRATEFRIGREQVSFMGDDLRDSRIMRAVGLAVAPASAHAWTLERAHWRTAARGGEGAARELCDLLLSVQGHLDALLAAADAP